MFIAGVHNLFVIVDCIIFSFMDYGRQSLQDVFIFGISPVLLQHTKPSLLPHICLAVLPESTFIQHKILFCTTSFN